MADGTDRTDRTDAAGATLATERALALLQEHVRDVWCPAAYCPKVVEAIETLKVALRAGGPGRGGDGECSN